MPSRWLVALLPILLIPGAARAEPAVAVARAQEILFASSAPPAECQAGDDPARIRCLVAARYAKHKDAQTAALSLYAELGDVAGLEQEYDMNGGYRGTIHIVPELPVGSYAHHLAWVLASQREIAAFVAELGKRAARPVAYRHRALAWKFFRSVERTTPSAYALDWEVGYNVVGSLNRSKEAVRDTLFHEVFHVNDAEHGGWSRRVLGETVDAVIAKCGTKVSCLRPYAPGRTMVRNGTYYAFQPGNGDNANEYGAELATRYFLEQRAALRGQAYEDGKFKCGPAENARAWQALVDEFFGGLDLVPPCQR